MCRWESAGGVPGEAPLVTATSPETKNGNCYNFYRTPCTGVRRDTGMTVDP